MGCNFISHQLQWKPYSLGMCYCGSIIIVDGTVISDIASVVSLLHANLIYVYMYAHSHGQGLVFH